MPSEAVSILSQQVKVLPAANALSIAQDRLFEKQRFAELQIPVPQFRAIEHLHELKHAASELGFPCILKTRRFGYDGKGQAKINTAEDIEDAWQSIAQVPAIVEAFMPFDREVSIIAVRDQSGNHQTYPLSENVHKNGILDRSFSRNNDPVYEQANQFISNLLDDLDYVGVLALELFQLGDRLYANEFAPRVHNSGHWTIEGTECSQFENHVRAIAGLPLGETSLIGCSVMINCIGKMPDTDSISSLAGVVVHDYGKAARAGRKVGHITLTADTDENLESLMDQVLGKLA